MKKWSAVTNEGITTPMSTCDYEVGGECLVTDLVQELSTALEIPFLLSESVSLPKYQGINSIENSFYESSSNEYQWIDEDSCNNRISYNSCNEAINQIKKENDSDFLHFLVKSEIPETHSKCDYSNSGSGSECSSNEKSELDTPPVTPPEERISPPVTPPNVFVFSPNELRFIQLPQEVGRKREKDVHNFLNGAKKVRIQPKPDLSCLNVLENQHFKDSSLVCNDFKEVQGYLPVTEEPHEFIKSGSPTNSKQSVLSREDLEKMQVRRKQERMIRNRESAYLSRKRKKEYVTHLEKQVQDLTTENKQLRLENYNLRERLTKYEEFAPFGLSKPRSLFTESPRKTTALLALLITVCLNIGHFGNFIPESNIDGSGKSFINRDSLIKKNTVPVNLLDVKHTRSLLWADPELEDLKSTLSNVTKTSCPVLINQTESIRLESELRRWIRGDEDYSRPAKRNDSKINQYFDMGDKNLKYKKSKRKSQSRVRKSKTNQVEVDVFTMKPHLINFDTFFEAIHRREDTFYLVSFSGDHLLLPALAHNKTTRPKMSLMLPAFLSNTTLGASSDQVEMMQIDCEVTNTQLLSVNETDIPSHMRPYSNPAAQSKDSNVSSSESFNEYLMEQFRRGEKTNSLDVEESLKRKKRDDMKDVNYYTPLHYNDSVENVSHIARGYYMERAVAQDHVELPNNSQFLYEEKTQNSWMNNRLLNRRSKVNGNVQYLEESKKNFLKTLIIPHSSLPNKSEDSKLQRSPVSYAQNFSKAPVP